MKCPRCGNTTGFVGSKQDYMSAFAVDNNIVRCRACGHDFDTTDLPKEKDVKIQRTPGDTSRWRKVTMKGGIRGFAPGFPSSPVPFLNQKQTLITTGSLKAIPARSSEGDEIARSFELAKKQQKKKEELETWALKAHPENLYKAAPSRGPHEISAYRKTAVANQDKKVREAREWAAAKNKEAKSSVNSISDLSAEQFTKTLGEISQKERASEEERIKKYRAKVAETDKKRLEKQ